MTCALPVLLPVPYLSSYTVPYSLFIVRYTVVSLYTFDIITYQTPVTPIANQLPLSSRVVVFEAQEQL